MILLRLFREYSQGARELDIGIADFKTGFNQWGDALHGGWNAERFDSFVEAKTKGKDPS